MNNAIISASCLKEMIKPKNSPRSIDKIFLNFVSLYTIITAIERFMNEINNDSVKIVFVKDV